MGVSAAIIGGSLLVGAVQANQQKQYQKGQQAALNRALDASIAQTPPPPSASTANAQAASAANAAAARQRKVAAGAGGSASGTGILTNPQGAGQAVTARKTLIGM